MLHSVQEKIRETRGGHGTSPRGVSTDLDTFDLPPPLASAKPTADVEMGEMARKFEEGLAELAPPPSERPSASRPDDDFGFEFRDDEAQAVRFERFAKPRSALGAREPVLAHPPARSEPAPSRPLEAASIPRAPHPARAASKPGAMIVGIAVALAVGAGAGFIAAKAKAPSASSAKIAIPTGSGVGLRLDYQLKPPAAGAKRRTP